MLCRFCMVGSLILVLYQGPGLAAVSGSEDGGLRRVLCGGSGNSAQVLHSSEEIGEHAAGTAIRALDALPFKRPGVRHCSLVWIGVF